MTQPYRPPTGSPRGWATKSYDPHVVAPLAQAVAVVPGVPTVWVGRNVDIHPPAAAALIAGETRTGVLPSALPFTLGTVTHQPAVTVSDTWVASATAAALAPAVWLGKVKPAAVAATAGAWVPAVTVITELDPPAASATGDVNPPVVM